MAISRILGSFSWLCEHSRPLLVRGDHISVLLSPQKYYEWLKVKLITITYNNKFIVGTSLVCKEKDPPFLVISRYGKARTRVGRYTYSSYIISY